ncbi:hypothetical protein C8J57DRAFT_1229738 [Mycena rebaudengoi]|nr:hypothetical protein C8J57DRAFT_1229738 [Mycena rebaudengoi]
MWRRRRLLSRAAARCRCHGSTAPVERVPCPSRQRFVPHNTKTLYQHSNCRNCDGDVQLKFNYLLNHYIFQPWARQIPVTAVPLTVPSREDLSSPPNGPLFDGPLPSSRR